jgi:hypothetical protein
VNATTFNLSQAREMLGVVTQLYNNLLDELQTEAQNLDGWAKQKFTERFAILTKLMDAIIFYDDQVQQYVRFHPDSHNVAYYKDKLEVARKYIEANGLDWSTVTWGKISDYSN